LSASAALAELGYGVGEGSWLLCMSDALAATLEESARVLGVPVARFPDPPVPIPSASVVLVEIGAEPDALAEEALRKAVRAGAVPVALLTSTTIASFARAIRAGAWDVIAAPPAREHLATRHERWALHCRSAASR
jgi:hypothetical protein